MRTRVLVGTVLLASAAVIAFFVPAALALSAAEREAQVVELLEEAADAAARLSRERDRPPVREADDRRAGSDRPGGPEHEFGVYDPGGQLVVGRGPADADAPVRAAIAGRATSARLGDLRVAAVPLAGGGAARAAEPAAEADARTRAAVTRLGLVGALVLVVAIAAAWLLARRLTRPLGALHTAATRLGGGDFTARAPATGLVEVDEVVDALNASAARIGALVERERRITADTSHQLRTPLAGLRLALETELVAPRPDPSTALGEALGAVERMETTVEALTDLARDEQPHAAVPIDDLARAAAHRWQDHYRAAGRALRIDATSGATVAARPAALDTVLDVLLDNALHHGRGEVVVATDLRGSAVRLVVTDQGTCHLAEEQLFARRRSGSGGSGIGLHLARTLADAEGGRIRLAAAAPTTFQLVLAAASASTG